MEKISLVGKSVLIKRDEAKKQTDSGLFLGDNQKKLDTGVIVKIGFELLIDLTKDTITGTRVRFRESFAEPIEIEGKEYLYFRELEPSIYYFIED